MPKQKQKESISTILLGDTLGELVSLLSSDDEETKLIVISIRPGGIRFAASKGLSKPEILGALYLAIDSAAYSEGYK